jgi:lysophospholipase L1-like esterase
MKKVYSIFIVALIVCFFFADTANVLSQPANRKSPKHWITAWSAAPDSPGPAFSGKTIRQIVRVSIAGKTMRLRLSNLFGTSPLIIGAVHIARYQSGSTVKPGTSRAVTFGGKNGITIGKSADVLSDAVDFPLAALEEIAVSLYLPGQIESSTIHSTAIQTAYITAGNAAGNAALPAGETDTSRFFLTDVEVTADRNARVFVIMGDSITDGVGSTEDKNTRWPDALAERLQSDGKFRSVAVVNSGISGNRILNDGAEPYLGPSGIKRFDRDVLDKPGAKWVLLFSGGNDISAAHILGKPKDKVSAAQIIDGMKTLIDRARKKGITIWGATLTPKFGARFYYPEGEKMRQEINTWIRTSNAFDGFVDFDQVIQDPARPEQMLPAYDSGDHVHPNDAGYKAMAAAIDLKMFR